MSIRASAPASTANLGPGFDCLGAALSIDLTLEVGAGEPFPKRIQRAIQAAGGSADVTGTITSSIPQARGLGSSAACVAAGLLIGCALAGREPDLAELVGLGTPIEGHPDNLAPALLGGFTVCTPDGSVLRFEASGAVCPVILVPSAQLKTAEARRVLAADIPRADAIANIARSSGLVALLSGAVEATPELLLECTTDLIHQPQRGPLMPDTADAIASLRAQGIAAAVSGAGPSVVCLVLRDAPDVPEVDGFAPLDADWSTQGARLL